LGPLVRRRQWMAGLPREVRCPNGHQLGAGQVLVGHQACLGHGGGHTTWTCRTCDQTVYGHRSTRTAHASMGLRLCGSRPHGTDAKRLAHRIRRASASGLPWPHETREQGAPRAGRRRSFAPNSVRHSVRRGAGLQGAQLGVNRNQPTSIAEGLGVVPSASGPHPVLTATFMMANIGCSHSVHIPAGSGGEDPPVAGLDPALPA
jgi:hypothetical protein